MDLGGQKVSTAFKASDESREPRPGRVRVWKTFWAEQVVKRTRKDKQAGAQDCEGS